MRHLTAGGRAARATLSVLSVLSVALFAFACATADVDGVHRIEVGPDAQKQALTALIQAQPGDVVEFGPGKFTFDSTLSLDVAGVTVRGAGMEDTILDFANQAPGTGGEGLMVTADDFVIEDLSVFNTKADAIKVEGTTNATFRRVFVNWEGEPSTKNGAYGLYPVQVENVLIEDSKVRGCSDAGIYVGQSKNIIVRRNEVWENVAGIEIENSTNADVYENKAWNNTGGILVFSLPELPVKSGARARVFDNEVTGNNHPNFGLPGAIVSEIPPGSGLLIMATDDTEVFQNTFKDNNTSNIAVISFTTTGREYDDADYDAIPEGISIFDNRFEGGGTAPVGALAEAVGELVGVPFPDVFYDGVVDESKLVDGKVDARWGVSFAGDGTFVNVDMGSLLSGKQPQLRREPQFAEPPTQRLPPVALAIDEATAPTAAGV